MLNNSFLTIQFQLDEKGHLKVEMQFAPQEIPTNINAERVMAFTGEMVKAVDEKVKEISGGKSNVYSTGNIPEMVKDYLESSLARSQSQKDDEDDSILDATVIDIDY